MMIIYHYFDVSDFEDKYCKIGYRKINLEKVEREK